MVILAIETSCDETAMAIVECKGDLRKPQFKVLADVVSSQIKIHRPFGGVVPMLAKREHLRNLPIIYRKILKKIENRKSTQSSDGSPYRMIGAEIEIDRIAVTVGPGLEPALWTGINFAKELAKKLNRPLLGVNHLEGHLFSNWLAQQNQKLETEGQENHSNILKNVRMIANKISFPSTVLLVSGGHTMLILMKSLRQWKVLGETRDDAAGEAFDKVARMLELPYPGGPEIEKLARSHKLRVKNLINFPRPMIYDKSYDFSFSGLKTAVLYYLKDKSLTNNESNADERIKINIRKFVKNSLFVDKAAVAVAFQQAVIDVLVHKTLRAAKEFKTKSILLCGGVACNRALQKKLEAESRKLKAEFFVPNKKLNTDNAVMMAAAAYFNLLRKKKYPLQANGNLAL